MPRRERLQKILAAAGVASRRRAEDLVRAGRVGVNGRPARIGDVADPERDVVTLDGVPVSREPIAWWAVHKPRGVVTTARDPEDRRTVLDLVADASGRLFPVGRLDRDTEGLVLLTNDGALAQVLLHPSFESEREYRVRVRGRPGRAVLRRLASGVPLEDGPTAPARVEDVEPDPTGEATRFRLTLVEGRKRQIRRALAALGHPVLRLVRIRMGPIRLGRLASGEARPLTQGECRALERDAERRRSARAEAAASPRSGPRRRRDKPSTGTQSDDPSP